MAKRSEVRTCKSCGSLVAVDRKVPSHVFHALMSILTVGLWLVVWLAAIIEAAASREEDCPSCGGRLDGRARWFNL